MPIARETINDKLQDLIGRVLWEISVCFYKVVFKFDAGNGAFVTINKAFHFSRGGGNMKKYQVDEDNEWEQNSSGDFISFQGSTCSQIKLDHSSLKIWFDPTGFIEVDISDGFDPVEVMFSGYGSEKLEFLAVV